MSTLELSELRTEIRTTRGLVVPVDGVSLTLEPGRTFALVGESGCGKSVTAMSIARLLPEVARIGNGSITLDGVDLADLPERGMRAYRGGRIAMIFQEPATSLNPVLPIGRQILETIETHTALRGSAARDKAIQWLRRVGIPEPERRIDDYPFQMSGGQKQRVMIAIALAAEPDVIVADEPTTALDVTIQKQILDLLRDLQREQGVAMLLITHDLAIVAEMAHRVGLMYAGQIMEVADTAEFFARPLHPYAQMLFAALPGTAKRGQPLAAIAGTVPALDRVFSGCRFNDRCPRAFDACPNTVPTLVTPANAHPVRCLLYGEGVAVGAIDGVINARSAGDRAQGPGSQVPEILAASIASTAWTALPTTTPAVMGALAASDVNVGVRSTSAQPGTADRRAADGTASPPMLELIDYRVWFPIRKGLLRRVVGYVKAVDGISLRLHAGRTLALVGESGCGKTTTGKALLQLMRGNARIGGQALLEGQPLDQLQGEALRKARRTAQIIFQDPFSSLNPRMRVAEILEEGVIALHPEIDKPARQARVGNLLDKVGLRADALGRYPHEFSGGQRQRIAIARALAVQPSLIVCDEPTSALDVSVQAQILNLLAQLQRELNVAYLFITHNFGVVEYLAHDIAVMQSGRIVEQGSAEQVLHAPGHPYTKTLLAAVPKIAAGKPAGTVA